jgi:RNA polymerase-binding transcription factor DksA
VTVNLANREAELRSLRERLSHAAVGIVGDDIGEGELNSAAGDQHLADHASEMVEREVDETLEENAEHVIEEIDAALARIADGTYGTCSVCGAPIPEERLDALPYATLCLEDKRMRERG